MKNKPRYIVLFGPPGSGKGTQTRAISEWAGLASVATGDIFRANLSQRTELGNLAKEYLDRGDLVPDQVTIEMVRDYLNRPGNAQGVILDGFPRTIPQAVALIAMVAEFGGRLQVVHIRVPDDILLQRVTGRIICRKCDKVYHLTLNPPPVPTVCEKGGECDFYQREDDQAEVMSKRLQVYNQQTMPLLEFFRTKGSLQEVDGLAEIQAVTQAIVSSVGDGASSER